MTNTSVHNPQISSAPHRLWAALQTRIQQGAARRQLGRELSPFDAAIAGVAKGDTAVTREIRAMMLHDFEHSA